MDAVSSASERDGRRLRSCGCGGSSSLSAVLNESVRDRPLSRFDDDDDNSRLLLSIKPDAEAGGGVWKPETTLPLLSLLPEADESRCRTIDGGSMMEDAPDSASVLK